MTLGDSRFRNWDIAIDRRPYKTGVMDTPCRFRPHTDFGGHSARQKDFTFSPLHEVCLAYSMQATFITSAMENGCSLEDVQRVVGRSDRHAPKVYSRWRYNPEESVSFFATC